MSFIFFLVLYIINIMGKYVYYPPVGENIIWMGSWASMSLQNLQNPDNVNARLTIKNRPKPSNPQIFENILEWEKKHNTY